ncbi:MAG TPA: transposase [Bdellovibrionales bacterium]|nr:transposase [Bdellovibrionales bacterium]
MHLVIRSSRAKGRFSLLKKDIQIKRIISNQADRFGVRVYKQANAGNHLHLTVLPRSRAAFNGFIRAITGLIARTVLGTERGAGKGLQFWDQRPFTRILEWGREFKQVTAYLRQNTLEALGFEPYRPRSSRFNPSTA